MRANQTRQNPPEINRLLGSIRECIESALHLIQNMGSNIECLSAKTILGLAPSVILRVAVFVLKLLLLHFAIDDQSFQLLFI
ncbi:MAG: hypothetical protein ABI947_26500 [Chloroflexota bacterium]